MRCSWLFKRQLEIEGDNNFVNDLQKQTCVLFQKGCPIPNAKAITFNTDFNIDLQLFYDEPIPEDADKPLGIIFSLKRLLI